MKLIGLMPCRNEDWVLGLTARAALMWCDELVLWLHSCTDGSRDIAVAVAHEHPGRVIIDVANDPTWAEMSHREQMLELARKDYLEFLERYPDHPRAEIPAAPMTWRQSFRHVGGFITFYGVNSAWLADDDADQGKLQLGRAQLSAYEVDRFSSRRFSCSTTL